MLLPTLLLWASLLVFVARAVAIWVAGVFLSDDTDVLADRLHLGSALGGLVLTQRDQLAFGDIFGGNAFLPVLLLLATVVSGKALLPNAHPSDLYLTALGALLTVFYLAGLLFRPAREHARLGVDSIAVLATYVLGVIGLAFLPS